MNKTLVERLLSSVQTPTAKHYTRAILLGVALYTAGAQESRTLLDQSPDSRSTAPPSYVTHSEPYITWLTQPEYRVLPAGLLGLTTPHNRWSAVDERLGPTWRLIAAVHENTHILRYLVGADHYLTHAQAENANRDTAEALLGPVLGPLHASLGRVPD